MRKTFLTKLIAISTVFAMAFPGAVMADTATETETGTGILSETQDFLQPDLVNIEGETEGLFDTEELSALEASYSTMSISEKKLEMAPGASKQLVVYSGDSDDPVDNVEWSSTKESVATVDQNGVVTTVGLGSASIKAKVDSKTLYCSVRVAAKSITLSPDKTDLTVGDTAVIAVNIEPEGQWADFMTVSSSQPEMLSIEEVTGNTIVVKAIGANDKSWIKPAVQVKIGTKSATARFTVQEKIDDELSLNYTELRMAPGQKTKLTINPSSAAKNVVWGTSDSGVAKVSKTGEVTAVGLGDAEISAIVGSETLICIVRVGANSITITNEQDIKNIVTSQKKTIKVQVDPEGSSWYKFIKATSSDENVVKVENVTSSGINIKAASKLASNKASATITIKIGFKTVETTITVSEGSIEGITLSDTKLDMVPGQMKMLTVRSNDPVDPKDITWSSSNTKVATVDDKGAVKGVGPGSANITAKIGATTLTCKINIEVKSIKLSSDVNTLKEGDTATINVEVDPAGAWKDCWNVTSSSKSLEIVSETNDTIKVKAKKITNPKGETAKVTVKIGPYRYGTISFTLQAPDGNLFSLSETKLDMKPGDKKTLKITPSTTKKKTWSSSDNKVVTVSQKGEVQAIAPGNAKITVSIGDIVTEKLVCDVTVTQLKNLSLNKTSLSLLPGKTEQLKVSSPEGTPKNVTWSSSNTSIATVSANGATCKVKAAGAGTATVKAQVGTEVLTCEVSIEPTKIYVTVDKTKLIVGEKTKAYADISPSGKWPVTWSSSNEKVATVDKNGNIKAISHPGGSDEALVKITATVGSKTGFINIRVKPEDSGGVNLSCKKKTLEPGNSFILTASPASSQTLSSTLKWTTSDSKVAKISPSSNKKTCTVTGVSKGTATIIVSLGNKSAECVVTVTGNPPVIEFNDVSGKVGETIKLTAKVTNCKANAKVEFYIEKGDAIIVKADSKVKNEAASCSIKATKKGTVKVNIKVESDGAKTNKTCTVRIK